MAKPTSHLHCVHSEAMQAGNHNAIFTYAFLKIKQPLYIWVGSTSTSLQRGIFIICFFQQYMYYFFTNVTSAHYTVQFGFVQHCPFSAKSLTSPDFSEWLDDQDSNLIKAQYALCNMSLKTQSAIGQVSAGRGTHTLHTQTHTHSLLWWPTYQPTPLLSLSSSPGLK